MLTIVFWQQNPVTKRQEDRHSNRLKDNEHNVCYHQQGEKNIKADRKKY